MYSTSFDNEAESSSSGFITINPPQKSDDSAFSMRELSSDKPSEMMIISPANRTKKLAKKKMEEFTINKLKFQQVGLVGREKETEALKTSIQGVIQHNKKSVVMIQGLSGVGKSSLAQSIKSDVKACKRGIFAEGKFDLMVNKEDPFSGIAKAYGEILKQLNTSHHDIGLRIGQELFDLLGNEVEPLIYLIPELQDIVPDELSRSSKSSAEVDAELKANRWKYSFRELTRLLTEHIHPLVVVFDDLQWADQASLDLIKSLICEVEHNYSMMIVCCYRSNEVDQNSKLVETLGYLEETKGQFGHDTADIKIEGCTVDDVNKMIMSMMSMDEDHTTKQLASVCFARTLGNPFFVIQFMAMLHREELLTFSLGTMKWSWDIDRIEDSTATTSNVAELLQTRLHLIPVGLRHLLQCAACLGPSFRVSTLEIAWKNKHYLENEDDGEQEHTVSSMLEKIQEEMLIEPYGEGQFRWVHDRIQEAALSLIGQDLSPFQFEVGRVLYFNLPKKELEEELFNVADLINMGDGIKSGEFATLCLRAAKKARKISAYHSACKYVANGIGMLPEDKWDAHRSTTLDLYNLGAEMELVTGNADQVDEYARLVLSHDVVASIEKIPVKVIQVEAMATIRSKYSEAIDLALAVLSDLGCNLVWKRVLVPAQALILFNRCRKEVKKLPKGFYRNYDIMTDYRKKQMIVVLYAVRSAAYHSNAIFLMVLCNCKIVELTLKHKALSEFSAGAIASLSALVMFLRQDYKEATMIAEIAIAVQNRFGRLRASQTIYNCYNYTLNWTRPLPRNNVLYEAYIDGMRCGEGSFSMYSLIAHFMSLPYMRGQPLEQVLEESTKVVSQIEQTNLAAETMVAQCYLQMFIKLHNPQGSDQCKLQGEAFNPADYDEKSRSPFFWGMTEYAECQLLVFYDDPSLADRLIKNRDQVSKNLPGSFILMIHEFHCGVAFYRAHRRTKRRKYRQEAQRLRKLVKKWKAAGNPNVVHYCLLLDAEQAALEGKYDKADTLYKEAIKFVARAGHLHHAALFNELYSEVLKERHDLDESQYRIEEGIRYYQEWGALRKVEILRTLKSS